jgi:hypothetical protein
VVHLLPLPGAPRRSPGLAAVVERAVADARALCDGGVDALIVENLGDAPFDASRVASSTTAAMTRVAWAVRTAVPAVPLGINVLRNDALAALAVAAAVDAAFVRVNVLQGAMITDQGWIEGEARALWLERNRLGAHGVRVAADALVKHAVPIGAPAIVDVARDLVNRGGADVVIVSGRGTGLETDAARVAEVRAAVSAPVWVGSGASPERLDAVAAADGAIVGTWLHEDARLDAPVSPQRVRAMRDALDALSG